MLVALTGTATTKFTDMMEHVFGVPEESLYQAEPTEGEEEDEDLPPHIYTTKGDAEKEEEPGETSDQPSSSQVSVSSEKGEKTPSPGPSGTPKLKRVHPGILKGGAKRTKVIELCPIKEAIPIFPTKSDQREGYLHAGVKKELRSPRLSNKYVKDVGYMCNFVQAMIDAGTGAGLTPCNDISSNMGQLSTHIRQTHLGAAVTCYVCGYRAWAGNTWRNHMKDKHADLGEDNFFISDEADTSEYIIKHEVVSKDD